MAIPIAYNFRNLMVRKTTTIMTALGIALTVAVLLAILAMLHGLRTALVSTGDPLHVLVLRKGANSELVSNFTREVFQTLKQREGIAHDQSGNPMASLEMVTVINLVSVDAPDGANVTVRGLEPMGIAMRKNLKLVAGRWFTPGRREVVVGESLVKRFPDAQLGKRLRFDAKDKEALSMWDTTEQFQFFDVFMLAFNSFLGLIGVLTLIVGGIGVSNIMNVVVEERTREIGIKMALGAKQGWILMQFLLETLLVTAVGGAIGFLISISVCAVMLTEVAVRITPTNRASMGGKPNTRASP